MTPEQKAEIMRLKDAQVAPKQIARKLGLRPAEVSAFIRDNAEGHYLEMAKAGNLNPLHECLVNLGAVERLFQGKGKEQDGIGGLGQVIISRQERHRLLVGSYLVDYWCLGLKNVMPPRKIGDTEYQLLKKTCEEQFHQPFVEISLEQAQSIVYGAVEYAQSLGLEPHKDFNVKAQTHLGLRPEQLLPLKFGKDGQPYYVSGPYDHAEKIVKTLTASVGEGNFQYLVLAGGPQFDALDFGA